MADMLDNERGPAPRWVVPLAMLAVVAVVVVLAMQWGDDDPTAAPTPTASASPRSEPTLAAPVVAGNACGGDVEQPLVEPGVLPEHTGLRLLVGGRDLQLVDVDAGTVKRLSGPPPDLRSVTELAARDGRVLAVLRDPCRPDGYGKGEVALIDPDTGGITPRGRGDEILPGSPTTVVMYDPGGGSPRLRRLDTPQSTPLPSGWAAYARTATGYFASVGGSDAEHPPMVGIGSPDRSALTKTFGGGNVVGAGPDLLFWLAGDCPGVHCLLTWTTVEGANTAQALDTYACCGTVSPDGTKLAFRKQRASGRLGRHPGPPNDIAVLDTLPGGPSRVLPGLVLPAKGDLTLAWSPDSQWLVIGADLGTGPLVLVWRDGMQRPAQVRLPPVGGGTTGAPALVVLSR